MKIQFGTPATVSHLFGAFFSGCAIFAIAWYNMDLQRLLGESVESILRSRGLNVTRTPTISQCSVPYDHCLCSVPSNISEHAGNCVSHYQLTASRAFPLVSFILQFFLVRELFSLTADHRRAIILALRMIAVVISMGMMISVYLSSCYQAHIAYTLLWTGLFVWCLGFWNLSARLDDLPSSTRRNKSTAVHDLGKDNKPNRAWEELP